MSQENKGLVNLLYVNFVLNISIPHEKKLRFSALNACTRILYVVVWHSRGSRKIRLK